ncbi:MAG: methyltransferase domain-containing protein [Alphaproteobacteria bacterium]
MSASAVAKKSTTPTPKTATDLDKLCCPALLASTGQSVPLTLHGSALVSPAQSYPLIDGIPDFRLTTDRAGTSYDDILPEWANATMDPSVLQSISRAMELTESAIKGKTVLVAGIGAGTELNILLAMAPRQIYAIDFSSFVLHLAKQPKYQDVKFFIGDLCNLPFQPDQFDYVISGGIIHHTRSPELAHRNIWRVTKPGGSINYSHIYLANLHNRRVMIDRERFGFHRMNIGQAKRVLSAYAYFYKFLLDTRIHKILNRKRWRAFFLLEGNHTPSRTVRFHQEGFFDYYLCRYRHVIAEDDVIDWFKKLGGAVKRVPKGFLGQKA